MERRISNRSSYAKLVSGKDARNVTGSSGGLKRSRSMRDSMRKLKVKLNDQVLSASPFKFHPALHRSDVKHYAKFALDKVPNDKLFQFHAAADNIEMHNLTQCDDDNATIEDLMSSMPMGTVPRKACKLLQIPETYCLKYLKEQQEEQERLKQMKLKSSICQEQNTHHNYVQSNNHKNLIYEDLSKCMSQGIYGTTRQKTATIRKPMPYLNSSRCYSNEQKPPPTKNLLPISSCLRSPVALIRQKSFHTLNELTKFCHIKSVQHHQQHLQRLHDQQQQQQQQQRANLLNAVDESSAQKKRRRYDKFGQMQFN